MRNVGDAEKAVGALKPSSRRGPVPLRLSVGALFAGTMMLLTSTSLPVRSISTAYASVEPCPAVQVVFARGTGEPAGLGRVGQAFVDSLRAQVSDKSVTAYAVDYPATRDFVRALDGANDAAAFIGNSVAACPGTELVFGGYSQGAAVIDLITAPAQSFFGFARPMPADIAPYVAAVAVFGNPSNRIGGGPLTSISPQYGDKTIDLCNGADPVCSNGNDVPAHSLYVEAGMASQAAHFVAQRLSTQPAAETTAHTAGVDAVPPLAGDGKPVTAASSNLIRRHSDSCLKCKLVRHERHRSKCVLRQTLSWCPEHVCRSVSP